MSWIDLEWVGLAWSSREWVGVAWSGLEWVGAQLDKAGEYSQFLQSGLKSV